MSCDSSSIIYDSLCCTVLHCTAQCFGVERCNDLLGFISGRIMSCHVVMCGTSYVT